jgi:hypothetical protein
MARQQQRHRLRTSSRKAACALDLLSSTYSSTPTNAPAVMKFPYGKLTAAALAILGAIAQSPGLVSI